VVIHDLDFIGVPLAPRKANAPLVVDANAVLAPPVTLQALQPISRQTGKGSHIRRPVKHVQLPKSLALDGFEPPHWFTLKEALGVRAAEGPDHNGKVYRYPLNVKQYKSALDNN